MLYRCVIGVSHSILLQLRSPIISLTGALRVVETILQKRETCNRTETDDEVEPRKPKTGPDPAAPPKSRSCSRRCPTVCAQSGTQMTWKWKQGRKSFLARIASPFRYPVCVTGLGEPDSIRGRADGVLSPKCTPATAGDAALPETDERNRNRHADQTRDDTCRLGTEAAVMVVDPWNLMSELFPVPLPVTLIVI